MKRRFIFVVSMMLVLAFALTGCTTPGKLAKDVSNIDSATSSDADALVESTYVLHDVMYFYDDIADAICIVDNGQVMIASVSDKFMMQFIVNGTQLFDMQAYNIPYVYTKTDGVGYLKVALSDDIDFNFVQYTADEFDTYYKDFEPRMQVVIEDYAAENGIELNPDALKEDSTSYNSTSDDSTTETSDDTTNASDNTTEDSDTTTEASDAD